MASESSNASAPFAELVRLWAGLTARGHSTDSFQMPGLLSGLHSVFGPMGEWIPTEGSHGEGRVEATSCNSLDLFRVVSGAGRIDLPSQPTAPINLYLIWVVEGAANCTANDRKMSVTAGDITLMRSWQSIEIEIPEKLDIILVRIPPPGLYDPNIDRAQVSWIFLGDIRITADFVFHSLLTSALEAFLKAGTNCPFSAVARLIFKTITIQSFNAAASATTFASDKPSRMARIYDQIVSNMANDELSPGQVAHTLKISTRTLHQTCANHGTTFSTILTNLRLQAAAHRLKTTDLRVSEIAFSVGYGSIPHFCRQFKNTYGVSARAFREQGQRWLPSGTSTSGSDEGLVS